MAQRQRNEEDARVLRSNGMIATSSGNGVDRAGDAFDLLNIPWSLFEAARRGDSLAENRLAAAACTYIDRVVSRNSLAQDFDAREDLVQLALIRVVRGIGRCKAENPAQLAGWIKSIVRRIAIDQGREALGRAVQIRFDGNDEALDRLIVPARSEAPAACERRDPEDVLMLRTLFRVARIQGSDTLRRQLALVTEHAARCLTWEEVAQHDGTTASAAKRRFQRAQHALRRAFIAHVATLSPEERFTLSAALARRVGSVATGWKDREAP